MDEESDDGRVYVPMVCIEGCTGETNVAAPLAVDGNDNGGDRTIANCLNGNVCILSTVAVSESSSETETDDEADGDDTETGADDPDGEVSSLNVVISCDLLLYISKLKT